MKNKSIVMTSVAIAATVALVSLGSAVVTAVPSFAHSASDGQSMGGDHKAMMMEKMGHMGGHMGGQSHRGGHMGGGAAMALDLDVDDVRNIIEGRMAMRGNDRLKVGKVEVVDDKTITAEIVTVDDSLVMKMEFDRQTGAHHPVK